MAEVAEPLTAHRTPEDRFNFQLQNSKLNESHRTGGFFHCEENMSKEEIVAAIRECALQLGHAPSSIELDRMMRITRTHYREHFAKLHSGNA